MTLFGLPVYLSDFLVTVWLTGVIWWMYIALWNWDKVFAPMQQRWPNFAAYKIDLVVWLVIMLWFIFIPYGMLTRNKDR